MAFVDVQAPFQASANIGGAPTGGGVATTPIVVGSAPGSGAFGANAHVRNWVIAFYVIIAGLLISAGVIFNGKG